MKELWPWIVMLGGIAALFVYRYLVVSRVISRLYEPVSLIGRLESRAPPSARDGKEELTHDASADLAQMKVNTGAFSAREVRRATMVADGHTWMPMAISLLVLLSALFVILSNNTYADAQQKWAFGAVGTILGYWFKK